MCCERPWVSKRSWERNAGGEVWDYRKRILISFSLKRFLRMIVSRPMMYSCKRWCRRGGRREEVAQAQVVGFHRFLFFHSLPILNIHDDFYWLLRRKYAAGRKIITWNIKQVMNTAPSNQTPNPPPHLSRRLPWTSTSRQRLPPVPRSAMTSSGAARALRCERGYTERCLGGAKMERNKDVTSAMLELDRLSKRVKGPLN